MLWKVHILVLGVPNNRCTCTQGQKHFHCLIICIYFYLTCATTPKRFAQKRLVSMIHSRLILLRDNKWCFINTFREEHAWIINTVNSSSVITPSIQSAWERILINNHFIISSHSASLHHPDSSPPARSYPSTGRSTRGGALCVRASAELGPLSPDSTPNTHILYSIYYM